MGTYDAARNKTKNAIIQAFWKLYLQKNISKITVKDITDATGIHRATFYLYYDNVFAVLEAIKAEQFDKLQYVCTAYAACKSDHSDILSALQNLYDENEAFLEPLLCQYRDDKFALEYRQIMKAKIRSDIGWNQYPEGTTNHFIIDTILDGLIETLISCLRTRAIPLDSAYRYAWGSVHYGIAPTLEREFGISLLPPKE